MEKTEHPKAAIRCNRKNAIGGSNCKGTEAYLLGKSQKEVPGVGYTTVANYKCVTCGYTFSTEY